MADGEQAEKEIKKSSRLEREREKVRIAQKNIDDILARQKGKQRKSETQQKILLGVMLKKMIAGGIVKAETFTEYSQTMNDRDRKVVEGYWASLDKAPEKKE